MFASKILFFYLFVVLSSSVSTTAMRSCSNSSLNWCWSRSKRKSSLNSKDCGNWCQTCQTQSRKTRNVGASPLRLDGEKADLMQRAWKGWPACSHSRSTNASKLHDNNRVKWMNEWWTSVASFYPRIVLQSGSRSTWAKDVTCRVLSRPSDPWTSTDAPVETNKKYNF